MVAGAADIVRHVIPLGADQFPLQTSICVARQSVNMLFIGSSNRMWGVFGRRTSPPGLRGAGTIIGSAVHFGWPAAGAGFQIPAPW